VTDLRTGQVFRELEATGNAGMNRVQWDLRGDPPESTAGDEDDDDEGPLATPGVYRVTLNLGGRALSQNVTVLEDVWMDQR
jgi:hypothetical protein